MGKPVKTNTDMDDGVFHKEPQNDADEFGHDSRSSKVREHPADLAYKTASNIVGQFAKSPKEVSAPKIEGEHPGVAAAKATLSKVVSGEQDGKVF